MGEDALVAQPGMILPDKRPYMVLFSAPPLPHCGYDRFIEAKAWAFWGSLCPTPTRVFFLFQLPLKSGNSTLPFPLAPWKLGLLGV